MFEMIGLVIDSSIFLAFSIGIGYVYGLATWIILPRPRKWRWIGFAVAIPILSAIFMWLCVALLPGESLFGDIDEPLPNGYHLTALSKMADYGSIDNPHSYRGVSSSIDQLAVSGNLVVGRYCQTCDAAFIQSKQVYFALDTESGKVTEFADLAALRAYLGQPIQLVNNDHFRSQQPEALRQQRLVRFTMFGPPTLLTIVFFAFVIRLRWRETAPAAPVYT